MLYTKNKNATILWFIPFLNITNSNNKNKITSSAKYNHANCPITWKIKCISFVETLALSWVSFVCSRIWSTILVLKYSFPAYSRNKLIIPPIKPIYKIYITLEISNNIFSNLSKYIIFHLYPYT